MIRNIPHEEPPRLKSDPDGRGSRKTERETLARDHSCRYSCHYAIKRKLPNHGPPCERQGCPFCKTLKVLRIQKLPGFPRGYDRFDLLLSCRIFLILSSQMPPAGNTMDYADFHSLLAGDMIKKASTMSNRCAKRRLRRIAYGSQHLRPPCEP